MSSDQLQLLLQSLNECCSEFQRRHDELLELAGRDYFTKSRRSARGIAEDCQTKAVELQKWCSTFQVRIGAENAQQHQKLIEGHMKLPDWIKDLLSDIKNSITICSSATLEDVERRRHLSEIEENLNTIDDLITKVEDLDKLLEKSDDTMKKRIIKEHQEKVNDQTVIFVDRIRNMPVDDRTDSFSILHRGCIKFETLDWFWSKILLPPGIERAKIRSRRFDGVLISRAHVEKAASALRMFIDAWLVVNPSPSDPESLNLLQYMPKIACVLYTCGRHDLFNKFIENEITDSTLDKGWEDFRGSMELAFKKQSDAEVRELIGHFSRVMERPWNEGDNLKLELTEPLPMLLVKELRRSQGPVTVCEVEDAWNPRNFYALKVVKTETADDGQRADLVNEIGQLLGLGQEDHGHHIVKCVKTYERGNKGQEIGMLLTPVADRDLNKFLRQCWQDTGYRRKNKSQLIPACGCLAYALAYMHNVKRMRHRDVKPHNILHHEPKGGASGSPQFLWADFGLAFVFREQGFSGDHNPNFGATPEYEAPEIDHTQPGMHTRASDIFALGCVLLEIACVLSMGDHQQQFDDLELRDTYWEHRRKRYYKHHIKGLDAWISDKLKKHETAEKSEDRCLRKILLLARKMINQNPDSRPKIGEIVLELWSVRSNETNERPFFCKHCKAKMITDIAKSSPIFKHDPVARPSLGQRIRRPRTSAAFSSTP